jgi:hypothetical protein
MQFGPEYKSELDGARISTQMERIREYMLNAQWRTLGEIRADLERIFRCRFPESSISAQLRHLKKPAFGSHVLHKRRRGNGALGLFEYRLAPPTAPQGDLFTKAEMTRFA